MALVKLLDSQDVGRVAVIKSLLDANAIPYVVQNEHFASLYPGVPLPTGMVIMVSELDVERAGELVREIDDR